MKTTEQMLVFSTASLVKEIEQVQPNRRVMAMQSEMATIKLGI